MNEEKYLKLLQEGNTRDLESLLKQVLTDEYNRSKGTYNAASGIKKLFKLTDREDLKGIINQNYLCTGYVALYLLNMPEGFPAATNQVNIKDLFKNFEQEIEDIAPATITHTEIKMALIEKAKSTEFTRGESHGYYDPKFIDVCYQILGKDTKIYFVNRSTPLHLESSAGKAIIAPVYKNN